MTIKTIAVLMLTYSGVVSAQAFERAVWEGEPLTLLEWAQMSDQAWKDRQAKRARMARICFADPAKLVKIEDINLYTSIDCEALRAVRQPEIDLKI